MNPQVLAAVETKIRNINKTTLLLFHLLLEEFNRLAKIKKKLKLKNKKTMSWTIWKIIYLHLGLIDKHYIYIPVYLIFVLIYYNSDEEKPAFSFDIDQEVAGLRKKRSQVNSRLIDKGLGDWEKHTKGIGAKLLLGVIYKYFICTLS